MLESLLIHSVTLISSPLNSSSQNGSTEHDSLSRQSSDSSSVFTNYAQHSSDSGTDSPRMISSSVDKTCGSEFDFEQTLSASTPEFKKSSLKSTGSNPRRPSQLDQVDSASKVCVFILDIAP